MFRTTHPASWTFHARSSYRCPTTRFWPEEPRTGQPGSPWKAYVGLPEVELPAADLPSVPLSETVVGRLSCRQYDGTALSLTDLSCLLHGSYGVLGEVEVNGCRLAERPVPSGGACYPLELYVVTRNVDGLEAGVYHYSPPRHRLTQVRGPVPWPVVVELFCEQAYLRDVAAVVILTAVVARILGRYGDRGMRFVYMEAGHLAQNLNLLATALEAASLDLGGFYDDQLAALLGVDVEAEVPVYAVAVGRPATRDRRAARSIEDRA